MLRTCSLLMTVLGMLLITVSAAAEDWARFRGPNGSGVSAGSQSTPTKWSNDENLLWKAELPGPGLSSPIVVGNKVLLTCWSGYGLDARNAGQQADLRRHLICFERTTGKELWNQTIEPYLPEDEFRGMFAENGYASHTPVSDGRNVYAFFGKSGALAFDLDGNKLWQKSLGTGSGDRGWGTSSSPILYKNLVIFPATAESESLVALNRETGEEVWRAQAEGFASTWGTPVLADAGQGEQDLVIAVPFEIWGFNPETGKLRWYCDGVQTDSLCSSVIANHGVLYAIEAGPRGGGAVAVKAGGRGEQGAVDVTDSHVLWTNSDRSRIGTPVYHEGKLYWVNSKIANCADAQTGERIYQERLTGGSSAGRAGGGGFGGRGGQDYSSPVAADGKLYYVTRGGEMYVLALGSKFEQLAVNQFAGDGGEFSATPAVADGQLFIRSTKFLYCVGEQQ
jgi:outer membrane protein assembly factor BamB